MNRSVNSAPSRQGLGVLRDQLKTARKEMAGLQRRCADQTRRGDYYQHREAGLARQITELQQRVSKGDAAWERERERVNTLTGELRQSREEVAAGETRITELSNALGECQAERDGQYAEAERLQVENDRLQAELAAKEQARVGATQHHEGWERGYNVAAKEYAMAADSRAQQLVNTLCMRERQLVQLQEQFKSARTSWHKERIRLEKQQPGAGQAPVRRMAAIRSVLQVDPIEQGSHGGQPADTQDQVLEE